MRTFVGAAGTPAGWVTTTFCPATVSVVVRDEVVVLPVTAIVTNPLPLPLVPLVMLNHDDASDDVQAQPPAVVIAIVALPPVAAIERLPGATAKLHDDPSCVIVTACPATVSVALRVLVVVFVVAV
jgi:hypothetical protein